MAVHGIQGHEQPTEHLANFKGAFYKFYTIRPWSASPKRGEDSPKSASFSLLTPHIPHNDSRFE